ncbi:MAG: peptide-methionine (S)-S-oxide reductase MsrA [Candidatus Pacebacteria bacterium]|nr:peptide-methionine (S)-S-oxide reductase MsrA [Candidatus Paceibacterota bacterium]
MDKNKPNKTENKNETAVFGGGCFWCTESVFKMLKGVIAVEPGYAGGTTVNPTYLQVCEGTTGHAEVIHIEYDPEQIYFRDLLTVFFGTHDPTTKNRQGNDVGTQYRSVIFYTSPEQRKESERFIKEINESNPDGQPVVTELEPLTTFYPAENYHHDYFAKNPGNGYCQLVINPKLEKVQKKFANLLKK